MPAPIRVLVVDDSALMRQVMGELISRDRALQVVGTAPDPYAARAKIVELHPDVITLDVEMPRMDGLSFLERLMHARPMPVVMVSSQTEAGCATTLRALELGAVDFVTKPRLDLRERLPEVAQEVIEKIKAAAAARVRPLHRGPAPDVAPPRPAPLTGPPAHQLIAVGASTGGTEALRALLATLPPNGPGVIVVQHMPEKFTRAFAERLDGLCTVRVKEAADGDRVRPGHVLLAPGNRHARLARTTGTLVVRLGEDPPVNRHRPSVDVLFDSCADVAGAAAVGVIMTGMGDDGARGLLRMRRAGAMTLAQDESSSVVFGMPRAAIEMGAVDRVLPLSALADAALAGAPSPDAGRTEAHR
jgi:two-component system chemotaxis response regulator CheB